MQETVLSRKLREHRASHPECGLRCAEYLNIVREHTEQRVVWEGPRGAHTRLSVVEAR